MCCVSVLLSFGKREITTIGEYSTLLTTIRSRGMGFYKRFSTGCRWRPRSKTLGYVHIAVLPFTPVWLLHSAENLSYRELVDRRCCTSWPTFLPLIYLSIDIEILELWGSWGGTYMPIHMA